LHKDVQVVLDPDGTVNAKAHLVRESLEQHKVDFGGFKGPGHSAICVAQASTAFSILGMAIANLVDNPTWQAWG
jgi:hypothetical protein